MSPRRRVIGTLVSFDEESGIVKVRRTTGSITNFKIELLSEEDQKYLKAR